MPYPGRNNIYEAVIRRMVNDAVDAQEREFAAEHVNDSDEQLIEYLQVQAKLLGHTPWRREILGGSMIEQRFLTWERALRKAKLPKPTIPDRVSHFARYQKEVERQKEIYRERKNAKKQHKEQKPYG